jgi:hypothetical protein
MGELFTYYIDSVKVPEGGLMRNMTKTWAAGILLLALAGCSQRHVDRDAALSERQTQVDRLAQTWGAPNTVMNLSNGNILYILGAGEDKRTATHVGAVPGHPLAMLSENGKPPRIVKDCGAARSASEKAAPSRIVWIETNPDGLVLLAGCSGCTDEEDRMLAMQVRREREEKALAKFTD